MIDDWGYEIGKVRPKVTEHYLTDAMDAYLQNKPIALDSTKAIGCYIEIVQTDCTTQYSEIIFLKFTS